MQRFEVSLRLLNNICYSDWDSIASFLDPYFAQIGFEDFLFVHSDREQHFITNWPKKIANNYVDNWHSHASLNLSTQPPLGRLFIWQESDLDSAAHLNSSVFVPSLPAKCGLVALMGSPQSECSLLCLSRRSTGSFAYELVPEINMVSNALFMKAKTAPNSSENDCSRSALLSEKQELILSWIAKGKSNFAISVICGISQRNVDYHVAQILSKLRVSSRSQAAAIYVSCNSHLRLPQSKDF
ncbi:helix-turn-helix transcriptional regulator [Ensifer sp. ENS02]|nr:helix-turn-helix transcriptional regulator [Ensifer sp. ENS02]